MAFRTYYLYLLISASTLCSSSLLNELRNDGSATLIRRSESARQNTGQGQSSQNQVVRNTGGGQDNLVDYVERTGNRKYYKNTSHPDGTIVNLNNQLIDKQENLYRLRQKLAAKKKKAQEETQQERPPQHQETGQSSQHHQQLHDSGSERSEHQGSSSSESEHQSQQGEGRQKQNKKKKNKNKKKKNKKNKKGH